jgi:hypothetical protein
MFIQMYDVFELPRRDTHRSSHIDFSREKEYSVLPGERLFDNNILLLNYVFDVRQENLAKIIQFFISVLYREITDREEAM